jgi:hypothetical protein
VTGELVEGTAEHLRVILLLLTPEERAVLEQPPGPWPAFETALRRWCGLVDGVPLFFAGIGPGGIVWMVATPEVRNARRFYLEASRQMCGEMLAMFPRIVAFEDATHAKPLRWLRWLGFQIGEPFELLGHTVRMVTRST